MPLWLLLALALGGCSEDEPTGELQVSLTLDPAPARVGETSIRLLLRDASGSILSGAKVRIEGNMNHAGMVPKFADAREIEPGTYEGTVGLSMAGDWYLVVTATTRAGRVLERIVDLPGVAAAPGSG